METGLSASFAPRRTRVICVLGEGDVRRQGHYCRGHSGSSGIESHWSSVPSFFALLFSLMFAYHLPFHLHPLCCK